MIFLKSSLPGLLPDEIDVLENYVLLHGIRNDAWTQAEPWTGRRIARFRRDPESAELEDFEPIDSAALRADGFRRRLLEKLHPFAVKISKSRTLGDFVTAIL